jgi:hypothetical protein
MIVLSAIVASALVIAQGLVVWAFLRFVKSFGSYTESQQKMTNALLYTHESNLAIHRQNQQMLEEFRRIKSPQARGIA